MPSGRRRSRRWGRSWRRFCSGCTAEIVDLLILVPTLRRGNPGLGPLLRAGGIPRPRASAAGAAKTAGSHAGAWEPEQFCIISGNLSVRSAGSVAGSLARLSRRLAGGDAAMPRHSGADAAPETLDPGLADLHARLTDRAQDGEPIDLDACLREHPQYADRLRALLPALCALVDVGRATPALPDDPAAGTVLGDYHVLRTLGRGGMGVVYEAVQRSLGRHVALKVLPPQTAADPAYRERFQREAHAAARLHHTNIVPVFGVGEHDGVPFYAMQFIDGEGLDVVLV